MTTYPIGGVDWAEKQSAIRLWVVNGSGLPDASVYWQMQPESRRPVAPAIALKISNIAETGRTWSDVEDNTMTFTDKVITLIDPTTDVLTCVGHGLQTGDGPVRITSTGTYPINLPAGTDVWFIKIDADTFKLAASYVETGGQQPLGMGNPVTPIDVQSAGTGTIKLVATADTVPANAPLVSIARGYLNVTIEMHCHTGPGVGMDMATSVLHRVRSRRTFPSQQDRLQAANIGLIEVDRVRAIQGTQDAVKFEPRAYCDIHFSITSEEAEAGLNRIASIAVQDLLTGSIDVITED